MALFSFGKKKAQRTVLNSSGFKQEIPSPTDTKLKDFLKTDAVLVANIRRLVDNIVIETPGVEPVAGKRVAVKRVDEYNQQLDDVQWYKLLRSGLYGLIWNGNMFFEFHQIGNKLTELYVIDPETVKIERDEHGEVLRYIQSTASGDITLNMDRIIHITMDHISTGVWGQSFIEPLEFVLNRKQVAENYMAGMLSNLAPTVFLKLSDSQDDEINRMRNEVRAVRDPADPIRVISIYPDEDVGRIEMGSTDYFEQVQAYIDAQNDEIIRILQTPPIVAGTVDNSNRSNSEIQARFVFHNTVTAWQNFLTKELNHTFVKRLGWKDVTFKFPPSDDREQEQALIRANKFKELGYSQEAIHNYLEKNGITIDKDFAEVPGVEGTKDINDMPSRQPRPATGIPQNEEARLRARENGMEGDSQ